MYNVKKLILPILLTGFVSSCTVSINDGSSLAEVIDKSDGTHKVYVAHPSKTQVVKISKFMMQKTCNENDMKYRILSESIALTGELISEEYETSEVEVFGFSKTDSKFKPKHKHEGEFHFECVG